MSRCTCACCGGSSTRVTCSCSSFRLHLCHPLPRFQPCQSERSRPFEPCGLSRANRATRCLPWWASRRRQSRQRRLSTSSSSAFSGCICETGLKMLNWFIREEIFVSKKKHTHTNNTQNNFKRFIVRNRLKFWSNWVQSYNKKETDLVELYQYNEKLKILLRHLKWCKWSFVWSKRFSSFPLYFYLFISIIYLFIFGAEWLYVLWHSVRMPVMPVTASVVRPGHWSFTVVVVSPMTADVCVGSKVTLPRAVAPAAVAVVVVVTLVVPLRPSFVVPAARGAVRLVPGVLLQRHLVLVWERDGRHAHSVRDYKFGNKIINIEFDK